MSERIGIVGGTFDPFHRGHLEAPLALFDKMGWTELVYVPAFQQPFKLAIRSAGVFDRVAMTLLALQDAGQTSISYVELERAGVSYSVDTLAALRSRHREAVFDWVIGDDNLPSLLEWRSLDMILNDANFVVLTRNGGEGVPPSLRSRVTDSAATRAGSLILAGNRVVPISSTLIRQRVENGQPIDELVDPRVERYIQRYGLYKSEER